MTSVASERSSRDPAAESGSARRRVHVLGVRHHGPGSARAVLERLEELQPDVVVVEGPADANPLAALAGREDLVPPVALLAYASDNPATSAFWPLAAFSPEWQALRWAARHNVPVSFCDLPASMVLAAAKERAQADTGNADAAAESVPEDDAQDPAQTSSAYPRAERLRTDPIAVLAYTAGYDDPERWWDDVVESRAEQHSDAETSSAEAIFEAITEAMAALRESASAEASNASADPLQAQREAHMRQVIRTELKAGSQTIAVVCGAWHAPVLQEPLPPAAPDTRLLRGMPKVKTSLTWIPWTHSRLSLASGYGAGITSPGWYAHLFGRSEHGAVIADWLTAVAGVIRAEDFPVSTAHVIEAVRLAETLAVLRGRPLAGLEEVTEATRAVLCEGNDVTLGLVTRRLVVGEALGEVPEDVPTVPLEQDLAATCRRLRIKREPAQTAKDLDLRKPTDTERSLLFHRLGLLGIGWATTATSQVRATGTFRESWSLAWRPEMAVDVVEAAVWGTTVASAATMKVLSDALDAGLPALTGLVERCLLARLDDAFEDLLAALAARAARDHDIDQLMEALPPLVRSLRYGDVRGTEMSSLATVVDSLLARTCAGLPAAVGSLDDDAATAMVRHIEAVHAAVALRDEPRDRELWLDTLAGLVDRGDLHGLLQGRIVRTLLDAGVIAGEQGGLRLSRALSGGSPPAHKGAWVEGFLAGGGLLLLHDTALLAIIDEWVAGLGAEDFEDVAPLMRRTFGQMAFGERRALGNQVKHLGDNRSRPAASDEDLDVARASAALARVLGLLGIA